MKAITPEVLKSILNRVEKRQETEADRQALIQILTDFISVLASSTQAENVSDALAALRVNDLENKRLVQELERRVIEQESIRQVSLKLTSSLDLKQVLRAVLQETMRLIHDISDAHIFLYEAGKLAFGAALWPDGRLEDQPLYEPRSDGLTYTVARLGKTVNIPDMSTHPLYQGTEWTGSIIGMPLKIGSRVVGVMTACRHPANDFDENELRLLQLLADHAAIAIENARLHNLVDQQAHLDTLTGLYNRRSLNERLEAEVLRYNAAVSSQGALGSQHSFSLLMMDLDGFKKINDSYGHLAGDYVLKEVSFAISQALRKSDFLSRFGGDEMALLLSDTDRQTAQVISARIQDFVSKVRLNLPNMSQQSMTISIGIAAFPENATTVEGLIEAADQALYQAKGHGPGSVVVSDTAAAPIVPPEGPASPSEQEGGKTG